MLNYLITIQYLLLSYNNGNKGGEKENSEAQYQEVPNFILELT
jgi:hypothetical protein